MGHRVPQVRPNAIHAARLTVRLTVRSTPEPNNGFKFSKFSKWRALRRRGDPGIDSPDSLPRTTMRLDRLFGG